MARRKREQGPMPDPEPWEAGRKPPSQRPRHENAQPDDPTDPADVAEAIEAESWGETVELRREEIRESTAAEEVLADAVADRRQVLAERLDEARELGLGALFEAALAATEPTNASTPLVRDDEVLHQQLAQIDAALEALELRSAAG